MVSPCTKIILKMSKYNIIDRRKNPKGKNLPNRKRFLDRVKNKIRERIQKSINERNITSDEDEEITINSNEIEEPGFNYDYESGEWQHIMPGNQDFLPGDVLPKPKKSQSEGGGSQGGSGEGEDDFKFTVSKEEYLDLVFEDLELPRLVKQSKDSAQNFSRSRMGHTKQGPAPALDLIRSLKNSLGRRIALAFPLDKKIKEIEELIEKETDQKVLLLLKEELERLKIRRQTVAYIDPVDIRYKRYEKTPIPISKAVMFCLMDVSGSMDEKRKELAKRFFLLLYLFLNRKYKKVDVVFIRHTETAEEVDEQTFFYDQESGGTQISSAVDLTLKIIKERYSLSDWNVYCVQASDGDNFLNDNEKVLELMRELLPMVQYYIYNEVSPSLVNLFMNIKTSLVLRNLSREYDNLELIQIDNVDQVIPTFRKVFSKNDKK